MRVVDPEPRLPRRRRGRAGPRRRLTPLVERSLSSESIRAWKPAREAYLWAAGVCDVAPHAAGPGRRPRLGRAGRPARRPHRRLVPAHRAQLPGGVRVPHVQAGRPGRRRRRAARPSRGAMTTCRRSTRTLGTARLHVTDGGGSGARWCSGTAPAGASSRPDLARGHRRGGRRRLAGAARGAAVAGGRQADRARRPARLDDGWAAVLARPGPAGCSPGRWCSAAAARAPGWPAAPPPRSAPTACWRWPSRCTRPAGRRRAARGRAHRGVACRCWWCRARPTPWAHPRTVAAELTGQPGGLGLRACPATTR